MKYYIIQENNFEYNDETYYRPDEGGGKPVNVFTDVEKAAEKCSELNCKEMSGRDIFNYGHDRVINDTFMFVKEFNKIFKKNITEDDLDYSFELPKMTVKEWNKIKQFINLRFFEIVEVNGD